MLAVQSLAEEVHKTALQACRHAGTVFTTRGVKLSALPMIDWHQAKYFLIFCLCWAF